MAKKLPITKRIKDEIFVWDPTAYQGKGYWYILGTTGAYGRPASSAEKIKLGSPSKAETTPESPDVSSFMDSPQLARGSRRRTYRKKRKLAGTQDFRTGPLKEIIFQKLFNDGKSIRNALEEALSEKAKAKVASFKDKFDPMNIMTKIYGDKIGAIIGRAIGRKESDIQKFTGYGKNEVDEEDSISVVKNRKVGKIPSLEKTMAMPETTQKGSDGKLAEMMSKIYGALKNTYDLDLTKKDNGEKLKKQKDAWNKELIKTITGNPQNDVSKLTLKEFDSFRKILLEKLAEITETVKGAGGAGSSSILPSTNLLDKIETKAEIKGAVVAAGTAAKIVGKETVESVAKKVLGKQIFKSFATKIPIVGLVAGLGFAASRFFSGDNTGAAMELGSAALGTIPVAGTAASVAADVAIAARDIYKEVYGVEPNPTDPEFQSRMSEITEVIKKLLDSKTEETADAGNSPELDSGAYAKPEEAIKSGAAPMAVPVATDAKKDTASAVNDGQVAPVAGGEPIIAADMNNQDTVTNATEPKAPETTQLIANEPFIPGKPLSKTQMDAVDVGKSAGTSYSAEVEQQYNKQKLSMDNTQSADTGSKLSAGSVVNQNLTSETTNGGSIVADNSKKITVINQNTDGLTVEQLTGVRLEESTFKKISRQTLRMV
jgi:hypothetical protein